MSEHVLITGASGFLGFHIVNAAVKKGFTVFAAVRKNSNVKQLADLPVTYLYLDYEDVDSISEQLKANKISYIIHAAGITKALKQQDYDHVNARYTLHLAQAAAKQEAFKKFVFISSLAATGPLENVTDRITETVPPHPVTAYGKSKLLAEEYLASTNIPFTVLRPTAIYGPMDKDIFIVIKTISKSLDPYIGKFTQLLSFVHAEDVAELAVQSLFVNNASAVYNITDGKKYDRYEFAEIVKRTLKKKAFRFHLPMPLVTVLAYSIETINGWMKKPSVLSREKLNELAAKNWICDISKAENELGFKPKYDLQSGLENSIEWYVKNKWL